MVQKFADGESWKTGSSLRRQRMEMYLDWFLTPVASRHPQSKVAFADQIGVAESTLWRYERDRWFQDELVSRRRGLFKVVDVQKIIENLVTIASDPENKQAVSAARTLLEWSEKVGPAEHSVKLDELSTEELMELAKELYVRAEVESVFDSERVDVASVEDRSEILL